MMAPQTHREVYPATGLPGWLDDIARAKRSRRLPVVLTTAEVAALLARQRPMPRIMAMLLYGSGLRLMECPRRHARDLDAGLGRVAMPHAMARKHLNTDRERGWKWIFPASRIRTEPRTGPPLRHHLHQSVPQGAIRDRRVVVRLRPNTIH